MPVTATQSVNERKAEQVARANAHVRHASCLRTSHAGRGRGSSLTFGNVHPSHMSSLTSRPSISTLERLHLARAVVGIAVIIATITVVVAGTLALHEGSDASVAMKWPGAAAVFLCWLFARIAKAIATSRLSST